MAEIQSWQRQNMSKNGGGQRTGSLHPKISGNSTSFHSKIAQPTVKNYADGGEVKYDEGEFAGVDDAVRANKVVYEDDVAPRVATDDEMRAQAPVNDDAASEVKVEGAGRKQSFKEAFAENRKAGNATFEWNGKKFNTEVATGKQAPRMEAKTPAPKAAVNSSGKTFAEDMAERKKAMSTGNRVAAAMERNENYGNEGRRSVQAPRSAGRGVIDTSNIDSKTLLPKR